MFCETEQPTDLLPKTSVPEVWRTIEDRVDGRGGQSVLSLQVSNVSRLSKKTTKQ